MALLESKRNRGQVSRSAVPGSPTLFYNEEIQVREFPLVNFSGRIGDEWCKIRILSIHIYQHLQMSTSKMDFW